jgi:hypothetical protein
MKRRAFLVLSTILLAAIVVACAVILALSRLPSTLTFTLEDSFSHGWVWDATIVVQNREIRSYFQSDSAPRALTFTSLGRGPSVLTVRAPDYADIRLPLRLRPGRNVLPKPIEMIGLRIPGLDHFTMVETAGESALRIEMRPVDPGGNAVSNHPCIPLWAGARVSAEVVNGQPARDAFAAHPGRGTILFNGRVEWSWNSDPAAGYRYVGTIPWSALADRTAPLLVIDYLVVVPDPTKIGVQELAALMEAAPRESDTTALRAYLDQSRGDDRFRYFLTASWNVRGSPS